MGRKTDLYLNYLTAQGYLPRLDADGDLFFQADGGNFILFADEEDESCFNLKLPAFWGLEDDSEKLRAILVASQLMQQVKTLKLYPIQDSMWVGVELLIDPIDNFARVFPRCLRLVLQGARDFGRAMEQLAG